MAIFFFDASALVKHYNLEPGSTWVRSIIGAVDSQTGQPIHSIVIADITITEGPAAFAILYRTHRIRRNAWNKAFDLFMHDLTWRYELLSISRPIFVAAAALTRQYPLKAYDAVQLAVALRYQSLLDIQQLSITFVSGDRPLLTAAAAEGLQTENPFDHVSPQDTPTHGP